MIIYMKKVLLLVFMLIFLVGCGKNENELIMVTEAGFAPYEYYDNGEIVRQKKYLAAVEDLKSDKVDAVVMDELPAKEIISSNNGLKILEGSLANDSYGMVVKKGNSELLNIINKVLNRLKEEGKIEEFVIKHTS